MAYNYKLLLLDAAVINGMTDIEREEHFIFAKWAYQMLEDEDESKMTMH